MSFSGYQVNMNKKGCSIGTAFFYDVEKLLLFQDIAGR